MTTKDRINDIRAKIEVLEQELKMVQSDCKHENTFEERRNWSYTSSCLYEICSDCDKIVKNLDTQGHKYYE